MHVIATGDFKLPGTYMSPGISRYCIIPSIPMLLDISMHTHRYGTFIYISMYICYWTSLGS